MGVSTSFYERINMKILIYYLALFTRILEFIMCVSIVLIPICMYLMNKYDWWLQPFENADLY